LRRRDFLGCVAAGGGLAVLPLGSRGWAIQNIDSGRARLVVIFLRGAVDGLNVVIPYTDPNYYSLRPTIAIPRPGQPKGAADLDGRFGLHPALQSLMPAWKERSLAFVHASGSPDESRSHFEAQAYMESGTPGVKITADGWMNRLLATLPGKHTPTEAINFGQTLPKILEGQIPVASIPPDERGYGRGGGEAMQPPAQDAEANAIFDRMYTGADPLSVAYREGRQAQTQIMSDLARDMSEAAAGAPSPKGFADDAAKLCTLMRQDPTIQLAFFGLSGWDTHVRQGGSEGQLANHLKALGDGLAQLRTGLGKIYGSTVVLVMSEFGRTARENGNGGTDHGHGNAMWVMGGPVKGGKIHGKWPGLDDDELHEGRDLAVTTDFRSVVTGVLEYHLKLVKTNIAGIFPHSDMQALSDLIHMT